MINITSPAQFDYRDQKSIFLAGSIEMNKAENWQEKVMNFFEDEKVVFINPRREDWNAAWDKSDINFITQVKWELEALDYCDFIAMYFDPTTQSPITLLELGLYAKCGGIIVCCPEGFWRKGNVEIVCERYKIPLFHKYDEFLIAISKQIEEWT